MPCRNCRGDSCRRIAAHRRAGFPNRSGRRRVQVRTETASVSNPASARRAPCPRGRGALRRRTRRNRCRRALPASRCRPPARPPRCAQEGGPDNRRRGLRARVAGSRRWSFRCGVRSAALRAGARRARPHAAGTATRARPRIRCVRRARSQGSRHATPPCAQAPCRERCAQLSDCDPAAAASAIAAARRARRLPRATVAMPACPGTPMTRPARPRWCRRMARG